MSPEEATKTILEGIELDPEQYRLGHTKVYFWDNMFIWRHYIINLIHAYVISHSYSGVILDLKRTKYNLSTYTFQYYTCKLCFENSNCLI
jgi:hypothetical protein